MPFAFYDINNNLWSGYYDSHSEWIVVNEGITGFEEVKQWAYIFDLASASKALEVVRELYLKKCEECGIWACPDENDKAQLEIHKNAYRKIGQIEFDKTINKIMMWVRDKKS